MRGEQILQLLAEPHQLETLYREDPEGFRRSLDQAFQVEPESAVLKVWRARLDYGKPGLRTGWLAKLAYAITTALAFGALVRLPAVWLGEDWYYPRFAPSWVILALSSYFWMGRRVRSELIAGLGLAVVTVVYVGLLPGYTDSVVMALLHLPIVFLIFLGFVFMGSSWRTTDARIRFVRMNGELLILASLVALGGMVFSGVTISLFELVREGIGDWYVKNVAVVGATGVPVAGAFLYDVVFERRTGIAAVLARVFAPLFLVMSIAYLTVGVLGGQNPFFDRSFLITFNGLLLVVLGITVFSIVEGGQAGQVRVFDYVNIALVAVTLIIDVIALSAILFRLASFGFTPNRVVVLGANLVIMVHLTWLCWTYVNAVQRKLERVTVERVVARYLPIYALWALVVAFLLPFVFGFD